ncbi:MAG TPA: hypothetical protein VJT72_02850 [Pseudonocardiaceae bacterium]|nr:hypothetical protein [Pseudonocardiaceae bacterium]
MADLVGQGEPFTIALAAGEIADQCRSAEPTPIRDPEVTSRRRWIVRVIDKY